MFPMRYEHPSFILNKRLGHGKCPEFWQLSHRHKSMNRILLTWLMQHHSSFSLQGDEQLRSVYTRSWRTTELLTILILWRVSERFLWLLAGYHHPLGNCRSYDYCAARSEHDLSQFCCSTIQVLRVMVWLVSTRHSGCWLDIIIRCVTPGANVLCA